MSDKLQLNTSTKLYYDGDSFSCMLPPGETQTTGHVIADRLGYELEHYGFIGKSPAQTIRSSVRYSFEDVPCFMAIGIGVISRLETFSEEIPDIPNKPAEYKRWREEDSINSVQIFDTSAETQQLFHWQYMEANLLFNLIQLHDYLLYNDKNFIIHNLGFDIRVDQDFVFSNKIYDEIRRRPRFINMFENSLHSQMKEKNTKPWDFNKHDWYGHPDEQGHLMYADYLMEHIDV